MAPSRGTEHNQTANVTPTCSAVGQQVIRSVVRETAGPSAKVPKCMLSGKDAEIWTTRRLAQKQPSFKECVTAH